VLYRVSLSGLMVVLLALPAALTRSASADTGTLNSSTRPANDGRVLGGDFRIDGVPRGYEPKKTYPITVIISQPRQSRWGFEIRARFAESGAQAGTWTSADGSAQVTTASGVQVVTQTEAGKRKGPEDGPVEFRLGWTAPDLPGGAVIFSGTGQAASAESDENEFVYTAGAFSKPAAVQAQTPEPVEVAKAVPAKSPARLQETSRIIDLPSPVDLRRHSMEIMIQHRFLQSVSDGGPGEAFGIDSGANMSIGFNYAVTNRISAGLSRTRFDQIVELSGTYEIETASESWWKLAVRGGAEGKRNFHNEYSPFLQVASSFDYGRLRLNVVPTASFNSRSEEVLEFNRPRAINPDSNSTLALGLGADVALHRRVSLISEYVPRLAGYGGLDRRRDQLGVGLVIRTWGHVFTIVASSSRDLNPSRYAVNAEDRSWALGFNLYRRMR
jgi:hypothetical protein